MTDRMVFINYINMCNNLLPDKSKCKIIEEALQSYFEENISNMDLIVIIEALFKKG